MKAFIWKDCKEVTDNYHAGGGVMIIAETVERAREIAVIENRWREKDLIPMKGVDGEPDFTFPADAYTEQVAVFPNAGCC